MSFEQRLNEIADLVENRLECLCSDLKAEGVPDRLHAAIRHALLAGGKRFRPFLVIESAALFGVPPKRALETAAAIECIHSYSLVHDDLPAMDNDRLRRGKPTVWVVFDDWTAILAGDALHALAFEVLADKHTHPEAEVRARLVSRLAAAIGGAGMVGGQALDLEAEKRNGNAGMALSDIQRLQDMKTGALIGFSCAAGALLAGDDASKEDVRALEQFGKHLGYAFQIADDLLDAQGDVKLTGKAVAKDTRAGKATLVASLGIDEAKVRLEDVRAKAVDALSRFGDKAQNLRQAAEFVIHRKR